jgi:hypothetical protein
MAGPPVPYRVYQPHGVHPLPGGLLMCWSHLCLSRTARASLLLSGLLLVLPARGEAQATRADSAAILLQAARDFQDDGRVEVAEALFNYITERFGDTWAGNEATAALQSLVAEGGDRSSQVELMVWATTYGAWLGVAIPGALGADSPEAYGAGLLVGGPLGFLGGRALARSRPLSEGQARAITFGSSWGTWMGYGVMEVLDWGEREECHLDVCYVEGPDGADVFKALVLGGLAGTATGAILARKPISRGVATASTLGALWGTWFGVAGGVLVDLEGDGLLASTLIGGNVALLVTAKYASARNVSRNRARLVSIAGVIGGLAGAGMDLLVQPDDEKVAIGIPLAGSIIGLAVGAGLTSGSDRPEAPTPVGQKPEDFQGTGGSLLRFQEGRLSLGVPSPFPTMVPVEKARGFSFRPAVGVTLLQGWF